jgi:tRNA-specific 2-thiouridylase
MPMYVLKIDADSGNVMVGPRTALDRASFTASGVNWISRDPSTTWIPATAQIRHRHRPASGRVRASGDGRAEFEFDEPQPAVTPGQAAVFYDGDIVIGGGWID